MTTTYSCDKIESDIFERVIILICKKCNTELSDNSVFCHICGEKVEQDTQNNSVNEAELKPELYQTFNPLTDFSTPSYPLTLREKTMVFFDKYKKAIIAVTVLLLIIIGTIFACSSDTSNNNYNYDESYHTTQSGYSEETLKTIAASQLYIELRNHTTIGGLSLSTWYDLGSTKYSIGSIVEDNGVYIVRGTFSLYDYYGKLASNYYNETFTVKISDSGYSCTTSL